MTAMCAWCGKVPRRSRSVYCSRKCKEQARYNDDPAYRQARLDRISQRRGAERKTTPPYFTPPS